MSLLLGLYAVLLVSIQCSCFVLILEKVHSNCIQFGIKVPDQLNIPIKVR